MAWLNAPVRGRLVASGLIGIASPAEWQAAPGTPLAWDDLFASTGLFGIEIAPDALLLEGTPVRMRGFMSPPQMPDAPFFVLTRNPLPNCPFCNTGASWPDDIAIVHVRHPGVDVDDPMREIEVCGTLSVGEAAGPQPGLVSSVRLLDAVWIPASTAARLA